MNLKVLLLLTGLGLLAIFSIQPALAKQTAHKQPPPVVAPVNPPNPSVVTIVKSQWIQAEQKNVVYKSSTGSKVAGGAAGAAIGYYLLKRSNPLIWGATAALGWMAGGAASKKPVEEITWIPLSRITLSNNDTLTVLGHLTKGTPVDPDTLVAVIIKTE